MSTQRRGNGNRGRGAGRGGRGKVQPGGSTKLSSAAKEELETAMKNLAEKELEEVKTSALVLKLQLTRGKIVSGLDNTWVEGLGLMIFKVQLLQHVSGFDNDNTDDNTQSFRREAREVGQNLRKLKSPGQLVEETSSDNKEAKVVKEGIGRAIVSLVEAYRKWRHEYTTWRDLNYAKHRGDQTAIISDVEKWYDGLSDEDRERYGKIDGVDQAREGVPSFTGSKVGDSQTRTDGTGQTTSRRPSTDSQQSVMPTATYKGEAPGGGVPLGPNISVNTSDLGTSGDAASLLTETSVPNTTRPGTAGVSPASTHVKGEVKKDGPEVRMPKVQDTTKSLTDSDAESDTGEGGVSIWTASTE